jgi:hypothetical protein
MQTSDGRVLCDRRTTVRSRYQRPLGRSSFLRVQSNRVLERTPEGIHQYDGGGYTDYVARTGQEAPDLRS